MDLSSLKGKVFQLSSNEEFGPIRPVQGDLPEELQNLKAVAEDSCGNYFVLVGEGVSFWDHETSEIVNLASSFNEFATNCVVPEDIELSEVQVESAWIDPEFLKELEINEKP